MTNEVSPTSAARTTDAREERGRQLARMGTIRQVGGRWAVPSQTRASERYLVDVEGAACTCPDFELRRGTCKHQHAVLFWIAWGRDVDADGNVTETVTVKRETRRKTYPQRDWRAYDESQTHEREYVERLLRALCAGNYTSLQKFLADPATTPILTSLVEQSAAPLNVIEAGQYAIDSTGFSTAVYDRWFSQKHGKLCSQNAWVKLHIACGTVTHAVTSAVVTPRSDDSQLPELLARTQRHFDVRELSADRAYSTHENHDVLESFNVAAYIPFKDNAVVNLKFPVWSRLLCEFLLHQDRFLPHYHRRSNVETVFAMIKAKFGAAVRSRLPVAQVNEVLAKCVAHNLCCVVKAIFTADLVPTFWPGGAL